MAISDVSICNKALYLLGEDEIALLTDTTKQSRTCNVFFEPVRDALLRQFPWNFAVKRIALSRLTTAPSFGFANQYQLPSDCLRVLEVQDSSITWKVEGRVLLTDYDSISIRYIQRITDPTQYDSQFVDLFSARLASEIAIPLTDSHTRQQEMMALYEMRLRAARSSDAQEGTPDLLDANLWTGAR